MSDNVDRVLERLVSLFPLPLRQAALPAPLRRVHQAMLRSLVERGTALDDDTAFTSDAELSRAIAALAADDLIVVADNRVIGAYPFTTEPTPHQITVNGHALWTMCALDALAVAPVFDVAVSIASHCPASGSAVEIEMRGDRLVSVRPGPEIQVGFAWRAPGTCAARNFCPGITFLRDGEALQQWRKGRDVDHDAITLEEAVVVAVRFFGPLMAREPDRVVHA